MDVDQVRAQFPGLTRQQDGVPVVYFDGPAGSQVPKRVADAVSDYLLHSNANTHGCFATARQTDAMLARAQAAMAAFWGAPADPVVFGANMTSLTFALSRALARTWKPGDEIIVTHLDHDANVTPWLLAARDAGVEVKWVEFRADDCTLDLDSFAAALTDRTVLLAVGAASNAVGTINPVADMAAAVHARGGEVFVDAVHSAPHLLPDVAAWDCDYAVCSAYKFFGPHVGILWGRPERMAALPSYQVRPAGDAHPDRWMTGTQNHEGIAGTLAAVEYLASLGAGGDDLRGALVSAYEVIVSHERELLTSLLHGLAGLTKVSVAGIREPARIAERVPTVSISHAELSPAALARHLDERGIYVWNGNYYALEWSKRLGLEPDGMVRIGLLHYNTPAEVSRLVEALAELD